MERMMKRAQVISPDPNLKVTEVGVPIHVAMHMTYPERVSRQEQRSGPGICIVLADCNCFRCFTSSIVRCSWLQTCIVPFNQDDSGLCNRVVLVNATFSV